MLLEMGWLFSIYGIYVIPKYFINPKDMRGSQILRFKYVSLCKMQPISYGDGNGKIFFTFNLLIFCMEFETAIGQDLLFFHMFWNTLLSKFFGFCMEGRNGISYTPVLGHNTITNLMLTCWRWNRNTWRWCFPTTRLLSSLLNTSWIHHRSDGRSKENLRIYCIDRQ